MILLNPKRRTRSYDEVYRFLAVEIRKRTTSEWQAGLEASDIPYAPMNTPEDLIQDPHLKSAGLVQEMEHPTEGKIRMLAPTIVFSETPLSIHRLPPRLGEHTQEVLQEFGIEMATGGQAGPA